MERSFNPEHISLHRIQGLLLEIVKTDNDLSLYSEIKENLESIASEGYPNQSKILTMQIMKAYFYNSEMISELKKLLTNKEFHDFKTWSNTENVNIPKFKCPELDCGSDKIAYSVYKIPLFDESIKMNLITKCDYPEYNVCAVCGCEFYRSEN